MDINSVKIKINIIPVGDTAIMVRFGKHIDPAIHHMVKTLTNYLDQHSLPGMVEYVPSFTSVTIFYDPVRVHGLHSQYNNYPSKSNKIISSFEMMSSLIGRIVDQLDYHTNDNPRIVDVPVCYGGEFGPDLEFVANHNNLSTQDVIDIHSSGEYLVYMIGFAPGFPYLGGMSERISTPRRPTPRMSITAGSVGIAGMQTGVYPISTPGGWQLIGRTPLNLFCPNEDPPSLLKSGDIIRFRPISFEEYLELKESAL